MKILRPYITINKDSRNIDKYMISFKAEIISDYLKVVVDNNKLILSIPIIDYNGKQSKISSSKGGWSGICVVNELLKEGRFYINEDETTEDEIVIYLDND